MIQLPILIQKASVLNLQKRTFQGFLTEFFYHDSSALDGFISLESLLLNTLKMQNFDVYREMVLQFRRKYQMVSYLPDSIYIFS